jgi:hypothetical protein
MPRVRVDDRANALTLCSIKHMERSPSLEAHHPCFYLKYCLIEAASVAFAGGQFVTDKAG